MTLKLKYLLALIVGVCLNPLLAQDFDAESALEPQLVIKARAVANKILLRWGVNDKQAWKYGIENGYIIERSTIYRNGKPLVKPENIILSDGEIRPKPLSEWESIIEEGNTMAAVTAQAIYGEDFRVSNSEESPVLKIINESSELQQRFGFSMFAVDQDFLVAQYAGLGFEDANVNENERYLYSIKLAEAPEFDIPEKSVLVNPANKTALPIPYDFIGYYYNDAFVLIWEYDSLKDYYNSYDLEKSTDGVTFSKVNTVPITKLADTDVTGISFTDSISSYETKYWYRIKGRTIFNELSPASDSISLIAFKELLESPIWKPSKIISEKEVILNWNFSSDEAWKVTEYSILRADKAIGPYDVVVEKLDPKTKSITYTELEDINYFKVRSKGIAEDFQESSPLMIQPIDSIPPAQPQELVGVIDTLGIVKLNWQKNTELDLKGYVVYKTNRLNKEFTRIIKQEYTSTSFIDTINLKNFNSKIFYKISALDNRYNESIHSEILALEKPQSSPPVSPLFNTYEVKDETVLLIWSNGPTDNIVKTTLYRKLFSDDADNLWENILENTNLDLSSYEDDTIEPNNKYGYVLTATNKSGIESPPSPPIYVNTLGKMLNPGVKGFYATVNREDGFIQLSWKNNNDNVIEIQLYRKTADTDFHLYQTFVPNENRFIDSNLSPNNEYSYALKLIYNDGNLGEWKEIEVKY